RPGGGAPPGLRGAGLQPAGPESHGRTPVEVVTRTLPSVPPAGPEAIRFRASEGAVRRHGRMKPERFGFRIRATSYYGRCPPDLAPGGAFFLSPLRRHGPKKGTFYFSAPPGRKSRMSLFSVPPFFGPVPFFGPGLTERPSKHAHRTTSAPGLLRPRR